MKQLALFLSGLLTQTSGHPGLPQRAAQINQSPFYRYNIFDSYFQAPSSSDAGTIIIHFATTSGVGMGAACACTSPSSVTGQTLNIIRSTSAYCSVNGDAYSNIQNGDLVLCGANAVRVEPNSAGVLGVRSEIARDNYIVKSQEFDTLTWVKYNLGAGTYSPILTANAAVAPDNTMTADRFQYSACAGAGEYSQIGQFTSGGGGLHAGGLFIKSAGGGGGSMRLILYDSNVNLGTSFLCPHSPTWTWCGGDPSNSLTRVFTTASMSMFMGCNNDTIVGGSNSGSGDVYLWQADIHAGAVLASPILTPSTSIVNRAADEMYFNVSSNLNTVFSLQSSVQVKSFVANRYFGSTLYTDAGVSPARFESVYNSTNVSLSSPSTATHTYVSDAGITNKMSAWYTGNTLGGCFNGTCSTNVQVFTPFGITDGGTVRINLGQGVNTNTQSDGIVTNLCFADNDSAVCR